MRRLTLSLLLAVTPALASAATLVSVTGGAPADFTTYTPSPLATLADPWPDAGAVQGASVWVDPAARVSVTLRGGPEDAFTAEFGDGRQFNNASAPGARIAGLSAADFLALLMTNEAVGLPMTDPSAALQTFGKRLEIGWTGTSSENDLGYLRMVAKVSAVPLPAGLPLLVAGLLALGAASRRSKRRL
jgi:hypothetical protein